MQPLRWSVGIATVASILACSGVDCGRKAAKIVPALEKVNPEFATEPVDCDEPYPTPAMVGCSMGRIECGDTVEGNTSMGGYHFGDDVYRQWFCTPERHNYDQSPEAAYTLEVPGDLMADIYLSSDCADLDVVALSWPTPNQCPGPRNNIIECEMDTKKRGGAVKVTTVTKPQTYLVIVDGKNGAEANFRLRVECHTYR